METVVCKHLVLNVNFVFNELSQTLGVFFLEFGTSFVLGGELMCENYTWK